MPDGRAGAAETKTPSAVGSGYGNPNAGLIPPRSTRVELCKIAVAGIAIVTKSLEVLEDASMDFQ